MEPDIHEQQPLADEVLASRSGARWSVSAGDWPDLPPEVVELLAAPVVVTAQEVPAGDQGETESFPPPDQPCAVRPGRVECTPSFLAPIVLPGLPLPALAGAVGVPLGGRRSRRTRRRI